MAKNRMTLFGLGTVSKATAIGLASILPHAIALIVFIDPAGIFTPALHRGAALLSAQGEYLIVVDL